jgi:hypothetical protein
VTFIFEHVITYLGYVKYFGYCFGKHSVTLRDRELNVIFYSFNSVQNEIG